MFQTYTVKVYKNGQNVDEHPCFIERRYSEFLVMFLKLRHEFPDLVSSFPFPKKVYTENFSPNVIAFRKASFEALLQLISEHEKMLESPTVLEFIQSKEISDILHLIRSENYKEVGYVLFNYLLYLNLNNVLVNSTR